MSRHDSLIPPEGGTALRTRPQQAADVCTHERRPGTTVCIHCRAAARAAARDRFNRLVLRGSATAIVVAIVGAGIMSRRNKPDSAAANVSAPIASAASPDSTAGSVVPVAPVVQPASDSATSALPPLVPVLPIGVSPLLNGMTAVRSDTDVVVSFDLPNIRTRQAKKFEQIVRETLGAVYGTPAVQALEKIPDGGIASQGNLITELPQRGARIPVRPGWAIRVFPDTSSGNGRAVVIRYRAVVVPGSE